MTNFDRRIQLKLIFLIAPILAPDALAEVKSNNEELIAKKNTVEFCITQSQNSLVEDDIEKSEIVSAISRRLETN